MNSGPEPPARCGLDTVEIARVERLLHGKSSADLEGLFTATELSDAGEGPGRAASLAARLAAKEACCKLFPRETALGTLEPRDFLVRRDAYGAPMLDCSDAARMVLLRHRFSDLKISLTHTDTSASAIAWPVPIETETPWFGKLMYHFFPFRRKVVMENLRRVFGETVSETEIRRIAIAYYAHYVRFLWEYARMPFLSQEKRKALIRVENEQSPIGAHTYEKGLLMLTGHFGNWEVATMVGLSLFPQYHGMFHFVRRPLKPALLNNFVTRRFRKAGFGTIAKRGSLDQIIELLSKGAIVVFVFDQHAGKREAVAVEFFGQPAGTFKSLALLALWTGAPVIPAASWRNPDGTHTLRFEDPLPLIQSEDTNEAIRLNTRAYNAMIERQILRHPEQWIWMHRRWKLPAKEKTSASSSRGNEAPS